MLRKALIASVIVLAALAGCSLNSTDVLTYEDYALWLAAPENGLIKTKNINGLTMTVRYLSPEFQAYQELKRSPQISLRTRDSILAFYKGGMNFMFTIGPDERYGARPDIMMYGVRDYNEYADRMNRMNFEMERCFVLKTEDGDVHPAATSMENVYGIHKHRNIVVTFVDSSENQPFLNLEHLDLVFTDRIFDTGINHFVFEREAIRRIPRLAYFRKSS